MARLSEGIEERLDRLDSEEHLIQFDSKVRLLKTDSGSSDSGLSSEGDDQLGRLVSLMEVLGRRVDSLDRKNRHLAEEIRHRDRRDRQVRRSVVAVVLIVVAAAVGGWAVSRFDHPIGASIQPR